MFKLRREHSLAFRQVVVEAFENRAIQFLVENVPTCAGKKWSEDAGRGQLRRAIARARELGWTSEHATMCYVACSFLLGEKFESAPDCLPAQFVMRNDRHAAEEKAHNLFLVANILNADWTLAVVSPVEGASRA